MFTWLAPATERMVEFWAAFGMAFRMAPWASFRVIRPATTRPRLLLEMVLTR